MNRFLFAMSALLFSTFAANAANAMRASAGYGSSLSLVGDDMFVLPKIADKNWRFYGASDGYVPDENGFRHFRIADSVGDIVIGQAKFILEDGIVTAEWEFEVKRDYDCNAFFLYVSLPCDSYAGGELLIGDAKVALPSILQDDNRLGEYVGTMMRVRPLNGTAWNLKLDRSRGFVVQDKRKWTVRNAAFEVRIMIADGELKIGEKHRASIVLSADDGIVEMLTGPIVVSAGSDWVPVKDSTDIVPGSALDFSKQSWLDSPAGKHGRIIVKGSHFEFEAIPGVAQRFYGVNLCFDANFPETREKSDELAARLARMGYNALRIHHHDKLITEGSTDGTTINPKRIAQLDDLAASCIEKGIYLTTDLFVSRRPSWRAMGIDRAGNCAPNQYKNLCVFHEGAYSNLCEFARQFLCHVNPRTGRRWADEPALAWLSIINEGNLGTYGGFSHFKASPIAVDKWKMWLVEKKKTLPAIYGDVTEDIPENTVDKSKQCRAFALFLADLQRDFDRRIMAFLRDEIKCKALISNMNSGYEPVEYQRVRTAYDYVDEHFYVDHPIYINNDFRTPSKCANVNPIRTEFYTGFWKTVTRRLLDKPFTLTEFNFAAPGPWRGVGGLMLGAQAALQDYDAVWRFAWSHDATGLLDSAPITYFDVARDPLALATERAALCLFMRRDALPLVHVTPIMISDGGEVDSLARGGLEEFGSLWLGWHSKVGTLVGGKAPSDTLAQLALPGISAVKDDYLRSVVGDAKPGDGQLIIDRKRGFFGVVTPRTCGFLCEGGIGEAGCMSAVASIAPSVVWASSLDGAPLESSRHVLVSHVADVQDEGITYADAERKTLVKWGKLPHLMRRSRADISLHVAGVGAEAFKVFPLAANGARRGEIAAKVEDGILSFIADTGRDPEEATFLYEIVR